MLKINSNGLPEEEWTSPKSKIHRRQPTHLRGPRTESRSPPTSTNATLSMWKSCAFAPGKIPYPFHSHSAQWEFYHVISGTGSVRDAEGTTAITAGDAFIFKPGEPHQFINDGTEDLLIYVVADNPLGESALLSGQSEMDGVLA